MLVSLSIRDVVLIDRLDLAFRPGLSALTGEGIDALKARVLVELGVREIGRVRAMWWTDRQRESLRDAT